MNEKYFECFEGASVKELNKKINDFAFKNRLDEIERSAVTAVADPRDGVFHLFVTAAFTGEMSLPLNIEKVDELPADLI